MSGLLKGLEAKVRKEIKPLEVKMEEMCELLKTQNALLELILERLTKDSKS